MCVPSMCVRMHRRFVNLSHIETKPMPVVFAAVAAALHSTYPTYKTINPDL